MTEPNLPSQTTAESDLRTAGQRKINLIWEYSQAAIALTVVLANVVYVFARMYREGPVDSMLSNAFFLVIGFYFGRTNHARMGDDVTSKYSSTGDRNDPRRL